MGEPVRLYPASVRLPAAEIGPDSPVPILRGTGVDQSRVDGAGLPADLVAGLRYGQPGSLLPYAAQDGYTRERVDRELPTLVLENGHLRAEFLPGLGGRLYSLVHLGSGRELLHRNPVLQPANLALRDAWFAGGVEWNLGATGHWPLTCAPLHAALVRYGDGTPVLRMYEFERMRRLVVQIDASLPDGSPVLYVHVRIRNPNDHTVPAYWWSNIAIPEDPAVRVLVPATAAFHHDSRGGLEPVPFPRWRGIDNSYPSRGRDAADFFFDLADQAADLDGLAGNDRPPGNRDDRRATGIDRRATGIDRRPTWRNRRPTRIDRRARRWLGGGTTCARGSPRWTAVGRAWSR